MNIVERERLFEFSLGGEPFCAQSESSVNGDDFTKVYRKGGLKITTKGRFIPFYGAYEWVNYFENTGDEAVEISELYDCAAAFPLPRQVRPGPDAYIRRKNNITNLYSALGSNWCAEEFGYDEDRFTLNRYDSEILPGSTRVFCSAGGRSSNGTAPFFNVNYKGKGYIFAIGWSGQWHARFTRTEDAIELKSGIQNVRFTLSAGEKLRTSSVVVMPYDGEPIDGHNKWRRLIRDEFSIIGKPNRPAELPFCAGIWGGMTSKGAIERIKKVAKANIPVTYFWMDAGWYGTETEPSPDEYTSNWHWHTGDWRVNKISHPDGLRKVSKAIHDAGRKFILWFEPERVVDGTPITKDHPEYFIRKEGKRDIMLNLGDEKAWNYCHDMLKEKIAELNIDCLRIDFNYDPLSYWQIIDGDGVGGITQIRYVNGLYRLWDTLEEEFPHLIIDDCASGGRRIDIETIKRSVPLWRSDAQCPADFIPEHSQTHNYNYGTWLPHSGTGCGRLYDEYVVRSSYAPAMTSNFTFSEREKFGSAKQIKWIKKYFAEYLSVRKYFDGDVYALLRATDDLTAWFAVQWHLPDENAGMVQVFKREKSPYMTAKLELKRIIDTAIYEVRDLDGGAKIMVGKDLALFAVTIRTKRKAKIFVYRKID